MILRPTLKTYKISIEEISKYAYIEINLNYEQPELAEYFKEEFGLFFDIGERPYRFGKHTFKNILILMESFNLKILMESNSGGNHLPLFNLKSCFFKTAEIVIVKLGKQEIPVLRLIIETQCDEELNGWLFKYLQTIIPISISSLQRNIGDMFPEKLKEDIQSEKLEVTTKTSNSLPTRDPETGRMVGSKKG